MVFMFDSFSEFTNKTDNKSVVVCFKMYPDNHFSESAAKVPNSKDVKNRGRD